MLFHAMNYLICSADSPPGSMRADTRHAPAGKGKIRDCTPHTEKKARGEIPARLMLAMIPADHEPSFMSANDQRQTRGVYLTPGSLVRSWEEPSLLATLAQPRCSFMIHHHAVASTPESQ